METKTEVKKEAVKVEGFMVPKWVSRGIKWEASVVGQAIVFGIMFICAVMGFVLLCSVDPCVKRDWLVPGWRGKVLIMTIVAFGAAIVPVAVCVLYNSRRYDRKEDATKWARGQLGVLLQLGDFDPNAEEVSKRIAWLAHVVVAYHTKSIPVPPVLVGQLAMAKELVLLLRHASEEVLATGLRNEWLITAYPHIPYAGGQSEGLLMQVRGTLMELGQTKAFAEKPAAV